MNGNNDDRREVRELFPNARRSGITAVALVAMLVAVHAKTSCAADTFPKAVLNAESAFSFPKTGPMREALRYSPSTGTKPAIPVSDQTAIETNDRSYGASLHVVASKLPFWTLSAGSNDSDSCSDKDGRIQCASHKQVLSGGMNIAVSTANSAGTSDLSGYMVVAAANLPAYPHESTSGVRYTHASDQKNSNLVPGINVLTSPASEPQIYTMMLAGLGLMGFVASRRQP